MKKILITLLALIAAPVSAQTYKQLPTLVETTRNQCLNENINCEQAKEYQTKISMTFNNYQEYTSTIKSLNKRLAYINQYETKTNNEYTARCEVEYKTGNVNCSESDKFKNFALSELLEYSIEIFTLVDCKECSEVTTFLDNLNMLLSRRNPNHVSLTINDLVKYKYEVELQKCGSQLTGVHACRYAGYYQDLYRSM